MPRQNRHQRPELAESDSAFAFSIESRDDAVIIAGVVESGIDAVIVEHGEGGLG